MDDPPPPDARHQHRGAPSQLLPLAVLVAVLALLIGGALLFPRLQRAVGFQDCVASGRTDC